MRYRSRLRKAAWALSVLKCMTYRTYQKENYLKFSSFFCFFVMPLLSVWIRTPSNDAPLKRDGRSWWIYSARTLRWPLFSPGVGVIPGVDQGCPVRASSNTLSSGGTAPLLASRCEITFRIWWLNPFFRLIQRKRWCWWRRLLASSRLLVDSLCFVNRH